MSSHAIVSLLPLSESEPILFLSLPDPVHENIVRFVGGGGEDVPESYGASLIVLAGVMPFYEELVKRLFSARYITMKTTDKLRLRLSSAFPPTFNACPQLIQACLCWICSFRARGSWALIQHTFDEHPVEWENLGRILGHNRIPGPLVAVVYPGWLGHRPYASWQQRSNQPFSGPPLGSTRRFSCYWIENWLVLVIPVNYFSYFSVFGELGVGMRNETEK